jgi:antitoxin ParD1/3/4
MPELHVSLPDSLAAALRSRVELGGYLDAPDYVRDMLRRDLSDHAEQRRWLKAMIDEGLASGVCEQDAFEVLAEIIAEDPDLRG